MHIQPKQTFDFKQRSIKFENCSANNLPRKLNNLIKGLEKENHQSENYQDKEELKIQGIGYKKQTRVAQKYENTDSQMSSDFQQEQMEMKLNHGNYVQEVYHPTSHRVSEMSNPFELSKDLVYENDRVSIPMFSDLRSTEYSSDDVVGSSCINTGSCLNQMGSHLFNLNPLMINRHFSIASDQGPSGDEPIEAYYHQNVFTLCNSPVGQGRGCNITNSNISRRLFDDVSMNHQQEEDIQQQNNFGQLSDEASQQLNVNGRMSLQQEDCEASSNQDDVDEFTQGEQRPLEQLLRMRGRNEFIFDPENGGGRRRRNKKVSRIELLNLQNQPSFAPLPRQQRPQISAEPKIHFQPSINESKLEEFPIYMQSEQSLPKMERPLGVNPTLYSLDGIARELEMIEEPRNIGKNSITSDTLASLINTAPDLGKRYLIIDCRFDYEFRGGHIKNAINISDPKHMQDFFFRDRETVENLMQSVVIFHCEFSQKRGPTMYSALREIDRRLHMNCYPQLFYPEIYILEGGYRQFSECHPNLCNGGYVPMLDKQFKADCKEQFGKHEKNFQEFNVQKKSRVSQIVNDEVIEEEGHPQINNDNMISTHNRIPSGRLHKFTVFQ